MDFSELAKTLFTYYGDGRTESEFVLALIDNIMIDISGEETNDIPPHSRSTHDMSTLADLGYNPMFEMDDSSLRRIYSGNREIAKKSASIILGRLDKYRFSEFILDRPSDTLKALCEDLKKYGITANFKIVGDICSDIFEEILKQLAASKRRVKSKAKPKPKSHTEEHITESDIYADNASAGSARLPVLPISTAYIKDGRIHLGTNTSINLPEKLIPPSEVTDNEMGYIPMLYEAYSDAEKPIKIEEENIQKYPKYKINFDTQRECYYNAVYVMERVRGVFASEDGNQFDLFKQEIYFGINTTYYDDYDNGFTRLKAVITKAASADVGKSMLCNIPNLIGSSEKMGVCHILVSDGKIKSWVNIHD